MHFKRCLEIKILLIEILLTLISFYCYFGGYYYLWCTLAQKRWTSVSIIYYSNVLSYCTAVLLKILLLLKEILRLHEYFYTLFHRLYTSESWFANPKSIPKNFCIKIKWHFINNNLHLFDMILTLHRNKLTSWSFHKYGAFWEN